ncbi:hypothetical protein EZV62_027859 [Acer yangbiense]|uniref:PGG domain-containing protein n=1 Tax=Acer yangbiense TaxID=1000413 RepID=A0A5C7GQ87_9ROSI|nr:hypothetical protein EZV62_027859 [Acer yangbiense]
MGFAKVNEIRYTPLHFTAHFGYIEILKNLLNKDKSAAYKACNKGKTALHVTAGLGKVPLVWLCPDQINVEMGGKCFVVKIEEEQFSIENLGIFPVVCAGTLIPVEGGSTVDICEEARRLTDDGDKATHEDSYEIAEVSVGVSASPIPLKFHFENLADFDVHRGVGVNSKGSGSLGGKCSASDKFFESELGQVRGKSPSEEKVRDEVGIAGPRTVCSSVVKDVLSGSPGLFQTEGYVPLHGSEVPSEKRSSKYDTKKQNSESVNLEDDIAKVLEKPIKPVMKERQLYMSQLALARKLARENDQACSSHTHSNLTFAAGFTVPGGFVVDKRPDQGAAILTRNTTFGAFVILNTMSSILFKQRILRQGLITYATMAMIGAFISGTCVVLHNDKNLAISACVT